MKVLIVGNGGREDAFAWKIAQSPLLTELFVAPGNAGTAHYKDYNVKIEATDIEGLVKFVIKEKIDLTVAGSEIPISLGITERFQEENLKIFAPTKTDALLETSKEFSKYFMKENYIPTASFEVFSDYREASNYINTIKFPAVIKANGLAYGKGAHICETLTDGKRTLKSIMIDKIHGEAGDYVIVEDYLKGEEYSAHAIYDSKGTIVVFPVSKDYQDFNERKTGGMGAIAPVLTESPSFLDELTDTVIKPAISRISGSSGACIYPGIIITSEGLRVLEFNARFGDPEAQVLLPLMKTDFLEVLTACEEGKLSEVDVEWYENLHAVCVVLASEGYPGEYKTGFRIKGVKNARGIDGVLVFHAGTVRENERNGKLLTAGGRVLNVVGTGETLEMARERAYKAIEEIYFEGMCFRDDIGLVSTYQGT